MTLSINERRAINTQNAQHSTGPKSPGGKDRSRRNALKHGLRAEALALPHEDPAVAEARTAAWNDFYQPQSPAAQHLVNECVQATLMAERCHAFHAHALSQQVRSAVDRDRATLDDEVARCQAQLKDDPAHATRLLERTAAGCRWMIERWERLDAILEKKGVWCGPDRDEAIRLMGIRPEGDRLKECPEAWLTRLYTVLSVPVPSERAIDWLFDPARFPEVFQGEYRPDFVPECGTCQASMRVMVAEQLAPLRKREEELRTRIERPDESEAVHRASILRDPEEARRFLRYHAESRTAFHRAFRELTRVQAQDEPAETAAPVSPNEPNRPAETAAPVSPNEPNRPAVAPVVPVSRNEPPCRSEGTPNPRKVGDLGGIANRSQSLSKQAKEEANRSQGTPHGRRTERFAPVFGAEAGFSGFGANRAPSELVGVAVLTSGGTEPRATAVRISDQS